MSKQLYCWCLSFLLIFLRFSLATEEKIPVPTVEPPVASPFGLREVKLLDGPFRNAERLNAAWLLSLDSDRLLSWYRKEAGLQPKAEVYGGWESRGIAGHSLGHYLSACARMYQVSGNEEFRRRVDYIVQELGNCQQAGEDGFVGAMPRGREVFAEVSQGNIRSGGFDLNGAWVPWYTLHKLFAGLIDAHLYCENDESLKIATRLANWADKVTNKLTPEQWQSMLACEFGGMNESLAMLQQITGNERYIKLARKFYHSAILDPMSDERDELAGKHANTQIPKVVGAAKIASLTGDEKYERIARFFWTTMIDNHTYVTGGNSLGEHLGPPGKLNDRLGPKTTETCNTYNMLKLTSALFSSDPDAKYADYAERALWNHILASQDSSSGKVCYFVPLQAGGQKPFQDPEAFTCCSGSGMENHTRYGEYIYAKAENALYVNQFISSELTWGEEQVKLRLQSSLPEEGRVRLEISTPQPRHFTVYLRHPYWAEQGFNVSVNSRPISVISNPGTYAAIVRTWKNGDFVEIEMPMDLRLESMPDNPTRVAVFYGPILLAGLIDEDSSDRLPVIVTDNRPVDQWLTQSGQGDLRFVTQGVGRPQDLALVPFCSITNSKYVVYWDIFSESAWQRQQEEYESELARLQDLEARTTDRFAIGEMQPERDHNLIGEQTSVGEFRDRKFRHATEGGWFSFDVALPKDGPADLVITYWGGEEGNRKFDLLIDGQQLATESLHQDNPGEFWDRKYQLPEGVTKDKTKATIKFKAHEDNYAGGVFGVRVVRRSP